MDSYILLGIIIALCYVAWRTGTGKKKPPGPLGLPFVGYIPFMSAKPHLDFQRLAKKYGNVFSIRLGRIYTIVLNDFQSTRDAYASDDFMGRPPLSIFPFNPETVETEAINGMPWKEQRRFALHTLRDLGFGKTKMEEHIQQEISELLNYFEQEVGKPFDVHRYLTSSMSNNIVSLLFGKRHSYDDPDRLMLNSSLSDAGQNGGMVACQIFFPWLSWIFKHLSAVKKMDKANQVIKDFIAKEIEKHSETLDPNNIRDFIDRYLLEIGKRKGEPQFCKPVLQDLAGALFGGGSETVRVSVEWLMLTMANYQDIQRRVHAEIDDVLGPHRHPTGMDSKDMPYTQAVINELMRWRTIIPINLMRYTLTDTELSDYHIPKHTYVVSNFWAIHHDPVFWGIDADDFKPDRFLAEDGKSIKKMEQFIPFSIGKRSCPGEPLGKIEVFLYFVSIMQRFHVDPPKGKTIDLEGDLGLSFQPRSQELVFTKREV